MAKILDGHIHIYGRKDDGSNLDRALARGGFDGGLVISRAPTSSSFGTLSQEDTNPERLENLLAWTDGRPGLAPFYWLDPLETDAVTQVGDAVNAGVEGFKIICDHFYPSDERAMPVYEVIAGTGRPILFHSGILWDGRPGSSVFNRPVGFEALLAIRGLRFSLAHISWPWCDELIAVYGKACNQRRRFPESSAEMFVDLTPGTPRIYRREALTRLLGVGYPVRQNMIFGSDNCAEDYDSEAVTRWRTADAAVYSELGLGEKEQEAIFGGNLLRFLGRSG